MTGFFWTRWPVWLSSRNSKLHDGPIASDPLLYYVSPLQLWLDGLVYLVNKAGVMDNSWLPVFTTASSRLRSIFSAIRSDHRPKMAFLLKWEMGGMLLLGIALELIFTVSSLAAPLILRELLKGSQNITLGCMLIGANLLATLSGRAKNQVVRTQSTWVETMVQTAIFEKSLRLSPAARIAHPPAQIINMSTVDTDFISTYFLKIHDIWVAPLQIITIVVLASSILGPSAFVGFILMLIMISGQGWASKVTRVSVVKYVHLNDQRLASLRELLNSVKGVKAAAYEFVFRQRVSHVRDNQLASLWVYLSMAFALFSAINTSIPCFTAAAAFLTYYLTGHQLTAAVVFPALAYFNLLSQPVFFASLAVTRQAAVMPSVNRIRALLAAEESGIITQPASTNNTEAAVEFKDASFTYSSYKDDPDQGSKLEVDNLVILRNKFTAVIGPTGSGKSSFLQAILGEMSSDRGSVDIYGKIAYVAQDAWVMSGTLRDNIVFMGQFNPVWYQEVIKMCCLDEDLRSFPGADNFAVGESGSNLSGGQRARIALARALYSRPDILLLDDPLSAVDGRVRELLFRTLRSLNITVVLVTLHTSFVPETDNVVMLEKGRVAWSGPTADFLAKPDVQNSVLREKWLDESHLLEHDGPLADNKQTTSGPPGPVHQDGTVVATELVEEEERAKGAVKLGVLSFYIQNAGGRLQAISIIILMIFLTTSKVMSSYWFVWWITDDLGLEQDQYLGGYLGLTLGQALFKSLLALTLVYSSMRASKGIHATIIDNLLSAPISYFQRQPTGRILNRLSSDIESLDTGIINAADAAFGSLTNLLSSLFLILLSSPIIVIAMVPYILITGYYQSRFRVCSRELKRSASILKSPVTTILSEALNAPASIKAFGAVSFVVNKHGAALDQFMSANLVRKSLDTWVTLRAEMASIMLLIVVTGLTVKGQIPDVLGGLALTFATGLSNDVFLLTWGLTDLEVQMNSTERLREYHQNIPKEGLVRGLEIDSETVPTDWPRRNDIKVNSMSLIYPSRSTPAVDNITLHVNGGERLGIVGRTGCGKSTLVSSIARLVDPTSGSITIDGVNTLYMAPQRLRLAVHTLPQEPLIFEGTIRENLDPRAEHTDAEILDVLDKCHLRSTLSDNPSKDILSQPLTSGGTDLSAGQRQLLCAARVLLERPPVLLVDEAAANIDFTTDKALQKALQTMLPDSTTMLIIAHRAASLAWLDRIIVMDSGKIVEEGTPLELLEKESYYRRAVKMEGEGVFQAALASSSQR